MAGDWIKLEHSTLDKPEVAHFADLLGISHGDALELLLRFWVWADDNIDPQNCPGFVPIMSPKYLDHMLHCPGFSHALAAVGWLKLREDNKAFSLPNFGSHNGQTAKTRAYEQKKKARQRSSCPENVPESAGPEKRREEVLPSSSSLSETPRQSVTGSLDKKNGTPHPKATRLQGSWKLPDEWKSYAVEAHNLAPEQAVRISLAFRDYWIAKPGPDGCKLDWFATWRNWVRRECHHA